MMPCCFGKSLNGLGFNMLAKAKGEKERSRREQKEQKVNKEQKEERIKMVRNHG